MRTLQRPAGILALLLAGCGSGLTHSTLPSTHAKTASVAFHIVPTTRPSSSKARRPKYVSLGTQSAAVTITSPGLPATTTVIRCSYGACNGTVDAPVATDTFAVGLYDDWNARGNLLSAGSTTQSIVLEQANSVNITFDGVPVKTTALLFDVPNPLIGTATTTNVHVNALDAAGFTIVGPGVFDPPIDLTLTDPSGSTSLSKMTVNSADDVVTLAYNGAAKISATVTSAVHGAAADQTAIFEPANVSAEYPLPNPDGAPTDIVQGPDGALWFTEGPGNRIGRIDRTGSITEYATSGSPNRIVAGPDGALWFSELGSAKQYGRVATDGSITEYTIMLPGGVSATPAALAFGADGNLYVADNGSNPGVDVVTPATGAVVTTYAFLGNPVPKAVVSGPDGNIWVGLTGSVGRIQLLTGLATNYVTSGDMSSVVAGTDGNVWFTDRSGKIGNVTPLLGLVTEYAVPRFGHDVYKIVAAPDTTYWFTYGRGADGNVNTCRIGHSTPSGSITSYAIADCDTASLAFGPDHNLWLAEYSRKKIGIFSSF